MPTCAYCNANDDHPEHYEGCPMLTITSLRAEVEAMKKLCTAYRLGNQKMADQALTSLDELRREAGKED